MGLFFSKCKCLRCNNQVSVNMKEMTSGEYLILCSRCRIYNNVMFELQYHYLNKGNQNDTP